MSRVRKPGGKYMNENQYDTSMYGPSKKVRIHHEKEDYRKATTLSQWLFAKYDMSYKTFRNKSKNRRDELRQEYEFDTGVEVVARERPGNKFCDDWDLDGGLMCVGGPVTPGMESKDLDLRGLLAYAKAQGKHVIDLSEEEKALFIHDKEKKEE